MDGVLEESTTGMANETFKMSASAPLWCWACYRRPCPAQAAGNSTLGGHVAQLNGGQAAKKAAVEAQISRTGRDGAYLHY